MRMLSKATVITAVAASALLSVSGAAMADPENPYGTKVVPAVTDIVGVGSDTSEYPLDQLALDYNASHTGAKLFSWDATNPYTGAIGDSIVTKSGAAAIARPNGSSAGITALNKNVKSDTVNYDIDFARSSRPRNPSDPAYAAGGNAFVVLADDAVTYATTATSNVPTNLTTANLTSIYNCTQTTWPSIKPFLPQTNSGTRAFFLSAIGVTTPGSCVTSGIQENDGTQPALNDPWAIAPYSVSKYIAQADHSPTCGVAPTPGQNKYGCDKHGPMVLDSIDGVPPTSGTSPNRTINTNFAATVYGRTIYNVVRYDTSTADHIPGPLGGIFGSGGWICTNATAQADLTNYGLLNDALCGATS